MDDELMNFMAKKETLKTEEGADGEAAGTEAANTEANPAESGI